MSATARKHESVPEEPTGSLPVGAEAAEGTEYATRGARGLRASRPHLRMVSPLRPERASRGVFALVVTGLLIAGMVGMIAGDGDQRLHPAALGRQVRQRPAD